MELQALSGMEDYLGNRAEDLRELIDCGRRVFSAAGYRMVSTPVLEDGRLFDRSLGSGSDVVSKEMYTVEQGGDRVVALRPENTAGVVRMVNEKGLTSDHNQLKFYYAGPMFRHERPQSGRLRQFHQLGLEVIGRSGPRIDAEVIALARDYLRRVEVEKTTLLLNSVGCSQCRPGYVDQLRDKLEPLAAKMCEDCDRRLRENPLRVLDCKNENCRQLYRREVPRLPAFICDKCQDHFAELRQLLEVYGVDYEVDPYLVRGLDYYSRTAFEFTSAALGEQDAVLAGGRYDGLVEELGGSSAAAIGFSAGLERLMILRGSYESEETDVRVDVYFIPMNEEIYRSMLPLAAACRRAESPISVEVGNPDKSMKSQLRRANRYDARLTVICGPREHEAGEITLKYMDSGEQETVPYSNIDEFVNTIRENL